jgi:hypothetical protein
MTKKLWYGVTFALILILTGVLLLPTMLGSKWIYRPLVDRLAADDFQLTIDKVQLRWFSPLRFEKVEIVQIDGTGVLSIAELKSNRSLLGYLLGGRQLGQIEIVRPTVDFNLLADSSNLDRLIKAIEGAKSKDVTKVARAKPKFDLQVVVREMSAKVVRQGASEPLVIIPPFDLELQYRALDGPTRLHVVGTKVLKEVELTPELIELGLGYAVPLLAKSAWFDGRISLDIGDIDIPLDQPIQSQGTAQITLHQVRSGPSQPQIVSLLDLLAKVRKKEPHHELVFVDGSQIKVDVRDSRVTHSGLQVGLPRIDPRFQLETTGSVGMVDKTLELLLQVPIPVEQLASRDQIKAMGVPTIGLPIGGTLDDPQIQWSHMREDSAELIGAMRTKLEKEAPATAAVLGALEGLAGGEADQAISAAVDLFKEFRNRRQASKETADAESPQSIEPPTTQGSVPKSRRPVRDALRDFLRGKNPSDE